MKPSAPAKFDLTRLRGVRKAAENALMLSRERCIGLDGELASLPLWKFKRRGEIRRALDYEVGSQNVILNLFHNPPHETI